MGGSRGPEEGRKRSGVSARSPALSSSIASKARKHAPTTNMRLVEANVAHAMHLTMRGHDAPKSSASSCSASSLARGNSVAGSALCPCVCTVTALVGTLLNLPHAIHAAPVSVDRDAPSDSYTHTNI